jgi:predicted nucleic acid-binding protein
VHILEKLYGKIIIPEKVFQELQGKRTPPEVTAWILNHPAWVEVRQADTSLYTPQKRLQEGEREAIALAIELNADALLSDDIGAIKEARRLNIPTVRLFNILESAAENDLLDLPGVIAGIRGTTFRLPPEDIIDAVLERDRKRREAKG